MVRRVDLLACERFSTKREGGGGLSLKEKKKISAATLPKIGIGALRKKEQKYR